MCERPNILIIYPDQMRADAMGCAGNPCVRTPNIDRLAREGLRFDHAYTSFPLCSPFRASLMTGKYAHANGMYANHYPIPLDQLFLADICRQHGYQTGYVGKWHLDGGQKHSFVPPERRLGFEWFVGFNRGHEYFRPIFYRCDDPRPRTSGRFEPDVQTDHLIEFLQRCRHERPGQPFLAMIAYGPPHPPMNLPERYAQLYRPGQVPVRANTPDDPRSIRRGRDFLARYYGLVSSIDANVGRILRWLDEAGVADNTIVYFVSDHGEMADEHGHIGKRTYYEASMRVPLIVRWPQGLRGGRTVHHLVDPAVDSMPTLLELCGLAIPGEVQGASFAPLLQGANHPTREAVFYEVLMEKDGPERFPIPERGVRTHEWLYVRTPKRPVGLFDLARDPLEMHNLVDSPPHAATVAQLDNMLGKHMRLTRDDWGIEAVFPPEDFVTHEQGHQFYLRQLTQAIEER